jgi:hypothetical protein
VWSAQQLDEQRHLEAETAWAAQQHARQIAAQAREAELRAMRRARGAAEAAALAEQHEAEFQAARRELHRREAAAAAAAAAVSATATPQMMPIDSTSPPSIALHSTPTPTGGPSLADFTLAAVSETQTPRSTSRLQGAAFAANSVDPYASLPTHHTHTFSTAALHDQSVLHGATLLLDAGGNSSVAGGGAGASTLHGTESEAQVIARLRSQLEAGLRDDHHAFLSHAAATAEALSAREAAARDMAHIQAERDREQAERERDAMMMQAFGVLPHRRALSRSSSFSAHSGALLGGGGSASSATLAFIAANAALQRRPSFRAS